MYDAVPWMKLSSFFTKGTVTQSQTVDGRTIIINWSAVPFVSYDNPWADIDRERAPHFKRGRWV